MNDLQYDAKLKTYISHISDKKFIIQITKLCGYSELMIIFKNFTLIDLYRHVSTEMECPGMEGLFFQKENHDDDGKLFEKIPLSSNMTIRDFINKHNLRPIYSIDKPCVYEIILKDGHN